jgi:hypothetical protein
MLTELEQENATKGIAFTRYCEDKRLSLRERVELFISVCRAVQHAHFKGIIHCALHPSHVVVVVSGNKPLAKVIDSEAATGKRHKLIQAMRGGDPGALADHLAYLSPEMADVSSTADIDTRSDVYSLGVLLYELVTGSLPVPWERLKDAGIPEALRLIREEEVQKPSDRLIESKEHPQTPATPHHMESREVAKALRGELDAVVMKALQKDPTQRYQTANELALDLQRYLADEPVEAYPSSGVNRIWKEANKYPRGLVAVAVLLLLLLSAGIMGASLTVWARQAETETRAAVEKALEESERTQKEAAEATNQRKDADTKKKEADDDRNAALAKSASLQSSLQAVNAVLDFFNDKVLSAGRAQGFSAGNWAEGFDKNTTLLKAVEEADKNVPKAFAAKPLGEALIREILGSTYLNLGEPAKAVKQYERALALREVGNGPADRATMECRDQLAKAYRLADRPNDASRLFDGDPNTPSHAEALAIRGSMLLEQKKPAEAESKLRECLAIREKIQPDDWTTFATKSMLGEALLEQKNYVEAEPLLVSGYKGLKQRETKIPPPDKSHLTKALERLVRLHENSGKQEKAAQWRKELELAKAAQNP